MPRSKESRQPSPLEAADPDDRVGLTDEIPLKARLRLEHAEKWVAWAPDERSIVASGNDLLEVNEAAKRAGFPNPLLEWVPPPFRQ